MKNPSAFWNGLIERYGHYAVPQNNTQLVGLYSLSRAIKSQEIDTTRNTSENANLFFMNGFGQISFMTPGCKLGQCCFCSYGGGIHNFTPEMVATEMDKFLNAIQNRDQPTYAILLDSVGSILDRNEFSTECLSAVFEKLNVILNEVKTIESVSFETHYQTLGSFDENGNFVASDAIGQLINFKKDHPNIGTFVVELGYETSNNEVRDNLLFKHIDDKTYKESVKMLHDNGIYVESNVMATLPFLTRGEQIEQSTQSIIDALTSYEEGGYGMDSVTLFPLNVRKHTFCDYVFGLQDKKNSEQGISSPAWLNNQFPIWSMVATLNQLIEMGKGDLLKDVTVAWLGGRQLSNDASEQFPMGWEKTYYDFIEYRKFPEKRVEIIQRLASLDEYKEYMQSVQNEDLSNIPSIPERVEYIHNLVSEMGGSELGDFAPVEDAQM